MRPRILTSAAADSVTHLELDAAGSELYGIADCSTWSVRRCEWKTKYDDGGLWAPRGLLSSSLCIALICALSTPEASGERKISVRQAPGWIGAQEELGS